MRTYRALFATPGFTPLFSATAVQVVAGTVTGLALGTLVYSATGSPLLSALSMFGSSFAQVLGATLLLSAADRLRPRAALFGIALVFAVSTAALAVPGIPVGGLLAIVLAQGVVTSVGGGVRFGLLNEILPTGGYLLGRSVVNMAVGVTQICGFALGGLLVPVLSARGTLLVGSALYLTAAAVTRFGFEERAPRKPGRASAGETWRTNRRLWASSPRRHVFLALWVPNGLIVGCESLFVSYDPGHAGLLFACGAAGMLAGDTVVGRFVPPWWRARLGAPLRLLLAVPYGVFALHPSPVVASAAVALASAGFAAGLLLQERLMALTPQDMTGQALGLHSSGMLTFQAVGASLAGSVAQFTSPGAAMTAMAVASVAVTLALAPGLRTGHERDPSADRIRT